MKNEGDKERLLEEFDKEVGVLVKIRSIYVINFVGAVYIVKKIAIVTEWADYGNIRTLMKTRTGENALSKALRVKFCFDAAKGIQYIHGNGILHRNIKPENFLVVSLQVSGTINAKLADFGSSRSINMMMTNMTFTKGIGSPKHMCTRNLEQRTLQGWCRHLLIGHHNV